MARFGKKFKKLEWWFLVGLVVILLATFSIASPRCGGTHEMGPGMYGGSFQALPNQRLKFSDVEVRGAVQQYATTYQHALGPTLRWSSEWGYVDARDRMDPVLATWAHLAQAKTAEEAGYRVSDEELRQALRGLVGGGAGAFSVEAYDRLLENLGVTSKVDFERLLRQILLRDKFLTPLIDGMRWSKGRAEAYRDWKPTRERVDLAYVAVPADPFRDAVDKEEASRSTIGEEAAALANVLSAVQSIRALRNVALEAKAKDGALPKDADELKKVPALKDGLPKDPWGKELSYRVEGDAPVVASGGPDGAPGTPDDVTPRVVETAQSLGALRQVGDALLVWRASVKSWPDALAKLAAPPPAQDGGRPLPAPLALVPKDGWDRDLVYEPAGPALLSTGADGVRGTEDDLVAEVAEKSVRIAAPAAFDAWRKPGAKDAWERPLRARYASANPPRFEVASDGADGAPGTDDDLREGNASDLTAFYAAARAEFREPDRRAFEAIHAILPLVQDEALKKAWAAYPQHRPGEDECYDRFRVHMVRDAGELDYYHVSEKVEEGDKSVTKDIDPADPVKGHGAALLAELRKAKVIPEETKGWLVPAPDVFGEQKDPPPPKPGEAAPPADPTRTLWLEKGWRRVLLREMFFERLLKAQLDEIRAAQVARKKWEDGGKIGDEPKVPAFTDVLAKFRDQQPGEADRLSGARFLEYLSREPLSREELEAIPEISDPTASMDLRRLKEGDVSAIPVVIKGSCARVVFRCTKFVPSHEPELGAVRPKVWPKYLEHRAMERAAKELQSIQEAAQKKEEGKPEPKLEDVAAAAAKARGFTVTTGTTGLFVGASPPRPRPVPDDATPERKDEMRRRNYVRTSGYNMVRPLPSTSDQPTPSTKVGAFGRRVLKDDATGDAATRSAYLVQVREQRDPSPEEFHSRRYVEWLMREAYDFSSGRERRAQPVRARSGYMEKAIARYLDEWESIKSLWGIQLDHPEIAKPRER